jgi:hypothetical protein
MSFQFPNVPALPGVPVLARLAPAAVVAAGATIAGETRAMAAALGLPATIVLGTNAFYAGLVLSPLNQSSPVSPSPSQAANANPAVPPGALPPYAISTSDNLAVIVPDTVLEFDVDAGSDINTHPIELGQFEAYNRVQGAIRIRMLMACQGGPDAAAAKQARKNFISTLESLREGTQIVIVSSPDASYPNMTLKDYGYKKRADNGAVTIYADTQWMEERSTNVLVSSPPASQPQGNAVSDLGSLTPVNVTAQSIGASIGAPTPSGYLSPQALLSAVSPTPAPLPALYNATAPPSGAAW